jgi:hypothetical protein
MLLSPEQTATLYRLYRGFMGEMQFAKLLQEKLHAPCIPIFSLHLEISGSECQFDCLLIFQHTIHLIEIKNYQGDYYVDGDQWFNRMTKKEWRNPINQLRRSDILLQQFLTKQPLRVGVNPHLVFVDSSFYLYQAPLDSPIIFSGQQHRYIDQLNQTPCKLSQAHERLAVILKAAHVSKPKSEQLPVYSYDQLKKGMVCKKCKGLLRKTSKHHVGCGSCGNEELAETAFIQNVKEFHLLFPESEITVTSMQRWSNEVFSKTTTKRYLGKHLKLVHKGKSSYYIF